VPKFKKIFIIFVVLSRSV